MKAKKKVVPPDPPAASPLAAPADQRSHRNTPPIRLPDDEPIKRDTSVHFPSSLNEIEGLSDVDLKIWASMAMELGRALWLERSRRLNAADPELRGLSEMDRSTRNHVLRYIYKNDPDRIPF